MKADWQPPDMSPLIKFYWEDIKKARRDQEGQGVKTKSWFGRECQIKSRLIISPTKSEDQSTPRADNFR